VAKKQPKNPVEVLEVLFPDKPAPKSEPSEEDIDQFIKEALKYEKAKMALAMMRRLRAEAEAEAERIEQEARAQKQAQAQQETISPAMVEVAKLLADLPEDKRVKVLQTLQYLMLMRNTAVAGDPALALLPLVVGVINSPQTPQTASPSEIAKAITEAINAVKALSQQQHDDIYKEVVKMAVQKLAEGDKSKDEIIKMILESRQEDPIQQLERTYQFLKRLGLAGQPGWLMTPDLVRAFGDVQMRLMKLEHMLKVWEYKWRLKLLREKRKLLEMKRRERRAKKALAAVIRSALKALEEGGSTSSESQSRAPMGYQVANCPDCGAKIVVPPNAQYVTCPKCGARYRVVQDSGSGNKAGGQSAT